MELLDDLEQKIDTVCAKTSQSRGYLGASEIGAAFSTCLRKTYYGYRNKGAVRQIDGRLARIFQTGHDAEEKIARHLTMAGCSVELLDPETRQQFEVSFLDGEFRGHADAIIGYGGHKYLGEFKTHKASSWRKVRKEGVKSANPVHYTQMQVYMAGLNIHKGMYVALNKDTEEYHIESVAYDDDEFTMALTLAKAIIDNEEPPERGWPRKDYYVCKMCQFRDMCWDE